MKIELMFAERDDERPCTQRAPGVVGGLISGRDDVQASRMTAPSTSVISGVYNKCSLHSVDLRTRGGLQPNTRKKDSF